MPNKIRALIVILILLVAVTAHSAPQKSVYTMRSATDDTMTFSAPSTDAVYTKAVKVTDIDNDESVGILADVDGGTVDLRVTVEGSFGPSEEFIETHEAFANLTDKTKWKLATIDTVVLPYMRIKLQGQGSNGVGTVIQLKIIK